MDFGKPYGFTADAWDELLFQDKLPMDKPVGMMLYGDTCSLIDRLQFTDVAYVRADQERKEMKDA